MQRAKYTAAGKPACNLVAGVMVEPPSRCVLRRGRAAPLGLHGGRRERLGGVDARAGTRTCRAAAHASPHPDPTSSAPALLDGMCVLLCRPRGAANVGALARLVQNYGCGHLGIVDPDPQYVLGDGDEGDDDEYNQDVYNHACKGGEIALRARSKRYASVKDAIATWRRQDADSVAETAASGSDRVKLVLAATVRARSVELGLDFLSLYDAGRRAADVMASGGEVVLLLGNERSGMSHACWL